MNEIPVTPLSQVISLFVVFLAGVVGAFVVSALSGKSRIVLLTIFLIIFLINDIQAAFGYLKDTNFLYRFALAFLVPVEIWFGHALCKIVKARFRKAI